MKYGYVRVSSNGQNVDRQIEAMKEYGLTEKNLFIDYESGKDFDRKNYKRLIKKIKKGDLIVIKSIDRLGRDYNKIIEQWTIITKEIGANIYVIDMPILNTNNCNDLIGKLISDIVLQLLSFVAQNERELIHQRQAEGIKIAKAKGVKFGRPRTIIPENFLEILNKHNKGIITTETACKESKMTKSTFYRYKKIFYEKQKSC